MRIIIHGCDDSTIISEDDWGHKFTPEELEIIGRLAAISEKISDYACMPTIEIREEHK